MILTTPNLTLRMPDARDAPAAMEFFQSDRSSMVGGPLTKGKAWRHFAAEVGHWTIMGCGMWAVVDNASGQTAGLIGPWCPADWPENEIGWVTFAGFEGRGIALEAARAAIDDAFTRLSWDTAVSYIDPDNIRSIALAERLGATLDANAPQPKPDQPCLVYRHPHPEARL